MNRKPSWFTIKRVHPQIYAIAEFFHREKVVSYLLVGSTKAYLIDTGMGYQSMKQAVGTITNLPVEVLLTHAHWDHIGSVHGFESVHVFKDNFETKLLRRGFASASVPELQNPAYFDKPFVPVSYVSPGKMTYITLKNDQNLLLDDMHIIVIHTPGHTPGSVCYTVPELHVIFTGDTAYAGPLYVYLQESNLKDYVFSMEKLKARVDKKTLIFPGHNDVIQSGYLIGQIEAGCRAVMSRSIMPIVKKDYREYRFLTFAILVSKR